MAQTRQKLSSLMSFHEFSTFSKFKSFPFHTENLSNCCRHKYDHWPANFTNFPILFLACFGRLEPLCAGLDRGSPGKNGRSTRAGLAQSGLRMVAHHFDLSDSIGTWLLTWLNLLSYVVDSQRIHWPKDTVQGNTFPVKIDKLLNFSAWIYPEGVKIDKLFNFPP